jgi:signal transduction histidine kinase
VAIRKEPKFVLMEVSDDGRSFQIQQALSAGGVKRLGLLGMRERVEMVDGTFLIQSTPGEQTTVRVVIPLGAEGSSAKSPARPKSKR